MLLNKEEILVQWKESIIVFIYERSDKTIIVIVEEYCLSSHMQG
jgi:hypothetical protein